MFTNQTDGCYRKLKKNGKEIKNEPKRRAELKLKEKGNKRSNKDRKKEIRDGTIRES